MSGLAEPSEERKAGGAEAASRRGRYRNAAGVLLAVSGVTILMGTITSEALYPAPYDTADNTISDLGGTMPSEGGVVLQPSAAIFDATMLASGVMILLGAVLQHRAFGRWASTVPLALLGLGVLGVGLFPGNVPVFHPIFALLAFVSGGLAAVMARDVAGAPFRYVSVSLGLATLVSVVLAFFFLHSWAFVAALGEGGVERWIAYPVVLWLATFGGYLMGRSPPEKP